MDNNINEIDTNENEIKITTSDSDNITIKLYDELELKIVISNNKSVFDKKIMVNLVTDSQHI